VCTCPNFFDQVDSCWITCSEVSPHSSGAHHATGFSLNCIAIGLFYTLFVRKSVVISSLNLLKFWEMFRQQHATGAPPEGVDQRWAANCHWGVDDGEQALMHSSWQMKGSQLQRRQQSLSMNFALPEKILKACRTNWRDRAQLLPACLVCSLSLSHLSQSSIRPS
jgi:hypothetical protein